MNKKMLCKLIFLFTAFLIIFNAALYGQSREVLNYRSLQASLGEKQVQTLNISVPIKDVNSEFIEVRLQDKFFSESREKKLDSDRLSIVTLKKDYHLKSKNIEIPVDKLEKHENKSMVLLETKITVKPDDLPGEYHNQLIISQSNSEGKLSEKKIPIKFKIEPWLELKINPHFHKLTETNFRERHLGSTIPGEIKISGNVPWQLFVRGNRNKMSFDSELILRASSEDDRIGFLKDNINIGKQKTRLATSSATAGNEVQTFVLRFDMLIKNFHQIKAGTLEFPLSFDLETLEYN
ncbi:MAG: hypothetical protein ACOC4G_07180 [Bacillota bacterium]